MLLRVGRSLRPPTTRRWSMPDGKADLAVGRARVAIVGPLADPAAALLPSGSISRRARARHRSSLVRSRSPSLSRPDTTRRCRGRLRDPALDVSFVSFYHLPCSPARYAAPLTSGVAFALYLLAILPTSLPQRRPEVALRRPARRRRLDHAYPRRRDRAWAVEASTIIAAATMLARITASRARGLGCRRSATISPACRPARISRSA